MIAEKPARAWSLITIDGFRQYGGNQGYEDDPKKIYRYDASVANCKQLSVGDLVFIRARDYLLGVARVAHIQSGSIEKIRHRCPVCSTTGLRSRAVMTPRWRCADGHQFDEPKAETIRLIGYEAHYGDTFIATTDAITVSYLKEAALRPNDQLSIEELDLSKLEAILTTKFPETRDLMRKFVDGLVAGPFDAMEGASTTDDQYQTGEFISSLTDTRDSILKTIKMRRGQRQFRNGLIKLHGPRCMVTGCGVVDILEAAHIDPYRGIADNHLSNGVLLRADIHTLFDLNLVAIDPTEMVWRFHPEIIREGYFEFDGIAQKVHASIQLASEPVARRWASFHNRL